MRWSFTQRKDLTWPPRSCSSTARSPSRRAGTSVIEPLRDAGPPVIAAANPLRGLATDAAAVSDVVRSIDGPVVLVAHSYGGAVISNVAADAGDIVGLVYVNAFAPEPGESCFTLAGMFPGSTLGEARSGRSRAATARPTCTSRRSASTSSSARTCRAAGCPDGGHAAAGHPGGALEPSGERPLWKEVPSWFLFGEEDRIIPAALQRYMAERANARRTIEIPGASHADLRLAARRDGAI